MLDIGRRIVVIGSTATGKSTLGSVLAERLGVPLVDLDALYWKPNWGRPTRAEFVSRVAAATDCEAWVVAGNYTSMVQEKLWPQTETLIFLDYPLSFSLSRMLMRAWKRWRSRELLWGTNHESLRRYVRATGSRTSLIRWTIRNHGLHRRRWAELLADSRFSHTRLVRLCSPAETQLWLTRAGFASP